MYNNVFLKKWLNDNGYSITDKGDERIITHVCMKGGKYSIPNDSYLNFFKKYVESVSNNDSVYFCERPSDVCKMFCDFDFVEDRNINLNDIDYIFKTISDTTENYFGEKYNVIICVTSPKDIKKNNVSMIKSGIHLIWEDLFLTTPMAKSFSKIIKQELCNQYGDYKWDDIIDDQVYVSGLRMIYSSKVVRKRKKDNSSNKFETVMVDEGRPYVPKFIYDIHDNFVKVNDESPNDKMIILNKCSIRNYNNEIPMIPIKDIPEEVLEKKKKSSSNNEILDMMERYIRTQTRKEWDLPLKSYNKVNSGVYTFKTESMFCTNIMRDHNSCGIYFVAKKEGLFQKCYCKCDTLEGRLSGLKCEDYTSKPYPLPMNLLKTMFPTIKINKTSKNSNTKKQNGSTHKVDLYSSNFLMYNRNTRKNYLKMSLKTIMDLENKINELQ